jgi:hypothetical protein
MYIISVNALRYNQIYTGNAANYIERFAHGKVTLLSSKQHS